MRKTLTYTVAEEGRDKGKVFVLTEMSATQAERWALRAFMALGRSGFDLPSGVEQSGFAGFVRYGLEAVCKLTFAEAQPLLDEMFACIQIQPSPSVTRALIEEDIEEVRTRVKLRWEVLKLHADFSLPAD